MPFQPDWEGWALAILYTDLSSAKFSASNKVTKPLQSLILSQTGVYSNNNDVRSTQISLKSEIITDLLERALSGLKRSVELAKRGAHQVG